MRILLIAVLMFSCGSANAGVNRYQTVIVSDAVPVSADRNVVTHVVRQRVRPVRPVRTVTVTRSSSVTKTTCACGCGSDSCNCGK